MKMLRNGAMKGRLGESIYYTTRYGVIVRRAVGKYLKKNTPRWVEIKKLMTIFANIWRSLTPKIRDAWESYAHMQGFKSEAEKGQSSSYKNCPITGCNWKPKVMTGYDAFVGANMLAAKSQMDVPRLYPPTAEHRPPNPVIVDKGCDPERGVLTIELHTPQLLRGEQMSDRKVIFWITVGKGHLTYVDRKRYETLDVSGKKEVVTLEFDGVEVTGKHYRYRPLRFRDLPYANISLVAQTVCARKPERGPLASHPSNIIHKTILNDPDYQKLERFISAGLVKLVGRVKFNVDFAKKYLPKLERRLAQIEQKEYVTVRESKAKM